MKELLHSALKMPDADELSAFSFLANSLQAEYALCIKFMEDFLKVSLFLSSVLLSIYLSHSAD